MSPSSPIKPALGAELQSVLDNLPIDLLFSYQRSTNSTRERVVPFAEQRAWGDELGSVIGVPVRHFGDFGASGEIAGSLPGRDLLLAEAKRASASGLRVGISARNVHRATRSLKRAKRVWNDARAIDAPIFTNEGAFDGSRDSQIKFFNLAWDAETQVKKCRDSATTNQKRRSRTGRSSKTPPFGYGLSSGERVVKPQCRETLETVLRVGIADGRKSTALFFLERTAEWRNHCPSKDPIAKNAAVLRVWRHPINAGYQEPSDGVAGEMVRCQTIESPLLTMTEYSTMRILFPTSEDRREINRSEFIGQGRFKCHKCQKVMVPREVLLFSGDDGVTDGEVVSRGDVLIHRQVYVCPKSGCNPRRINEAGDLHEQVEGVLALMSGLRGRPSDLAEQWQTLRPDERKVFLKLHVPQTLKVRDGLLIPPTWAAGQSEAAAN